MGRHSAPIVTTPIRHGNRNDAENRAGALTLELEPDTDDQEPEYAGQHRVTPE